jgi:hypothetical protein
MIPGMKPAAIGRIRFPQDSRPSRTSAGAWANPYRAPVGLGLEPVVVGDQKIDRLAKISCGAGVEHRGLQVGDDEALADLAAVRIVINEARRDLYVFV